MLVLVLVLKNSLKTNVKSLFLQVLVLVSLVLVLVCPVLIKITGFNLVLI